MPRLLPVVPERKLFVEAVAAEVAHDLMAPIGYFRSLVERSARGQTLDQEDLDIAREELARLETLATTLKRLAAHRIDRAEVSLAELVRGFDEPRWKKLEIDVDPEIRLACDAVRIVVALEALAENALAAAGAEGRAGLESRANRESLVICVWDTGPGLGKSPAFAESSSAERSGLGLTVAGRAIRAHGWSLELTSGERTRATIHVRSADVLS